MGLGAQVEIRRGDVVGRIEAELRLQPGRGEDAHRVAFFVGAGRIVAQLLHRMRHRPPGIEQRIPAPLGQGLVVVAHADHRRGAGLGDALRAFHQAVLRDQIGEFGAILGRNLHHCAELFVEQRAAGIVAAAFAPAVEQDVQAQVRTERHFAQRGEGAAIGAVVIGQQQAGFARVADQFEETAQAFGAVEIRAIAAETVVALRQDRTAEALLTGAQADQPQLGVGFARQQRRQLRARIDDRRERGDHQRYRRHRFVRLAVLRPLRLHRQRILADRNAQIDRRAQLHADRFDRIE